jgi:hypothetical protein
VNVTVRKIVVVGIGMLLAVLLRLVFLLLVIESVPGK